MNELDLPYKFKPRSYQLPLCKAIDNGYKRAVSVWHRRSGKDKTLLNIMVKEAFKRVGIYYYFFPTYKQGRMVLWDGIDRDGFPFLGHIPKEIRTKTNDQEMKIQFKNGSRFQVVGTDDIDKIVGTNPVGCIFSEYALQKPEAWDFIRPILRENGGWALFNYTPRGLNHGFNIYEMARKSPHWFCDLLTINDTKREDGTPVITQEMIAAERTEGMSENMIMQEYYCDFTASADDVLIPLDIILKATGKVIHPSVYSWSPKIFSIDVARFGDDRSAFITRQGLASYGLQKFRGLDNMELADKAAHQINENKPDAVFVDGGRGEGVIDRLRQLGFTVAEVNYGGRANDSIRYFNKRAEMWDLCSKWLADGGSIPDDQELKTDLSIPTYSMEQDRVKLLSKKKMKEENGFSPDCGDALAQTFAFPVVIVDERIGKRRSQAKTEYDIFRGQKTPDKKNFAKTEYDIFR